ncbi:MAG: replication initiation factor domain-containing protein [Pseudomonadota bacterium]|nr:replication initiation factor domain-containing protein [Pseudomonadota bacterium]
MNNNLISYILHKGNLAVERQDIRLSVFGLDSMIGDWEFLKHDQAIPIKNEYSDASAAFIDWLNFTFGLEYYDGHHDWLYKLSDDLESIFGFGITEKRDRGLNFYEKSYILGNDWGFVCLGGNLDTALIVLNAKGCAASRDGWEEELHCWSKSVPRFRITRIDLAHDDFEGKYNVDRAVSDYDNGLFGMGGRIPEIQQLGNWRNVLSFKGRTVYIGSRTSGKLCRIYEKGKQLGDAFNKWVRIECEFHNKDRLIPSDTLLYPGNYLAGAYPAFFFISTRQSKIKTLKKICELTYEKLVNTARQQFGRLLYYMTFVENSAQDIIDKLIVPEFPTSLVVPSFTDSYPPIHGFDYRDGGLEILKSSAPHLGEGRGAF